MRNIKTMTEKKYNELLDRESQLLDIIQYEDNSAAYLELKSIQWDISLYEDENILLYGEENKSIH